MCKPEIIQQDSERLLADRSLPDMLMPIQLGSAGSFRIVTVPDLHPVQADGRIEMLQRLKDAFFADDVVSGDMRVTGIDACGYRHDSVQPEENLGDLLEASSQRKLGSGGIFNQNRQSALGQIKSLRRSSNGGRCAQQALFP